MNFIIDFKPATPEEAINGFFTENKCTIVTKYENFDNVYLVSAATAPVPNAIVDSIVDDDTATLKLLSVSDSPEVEFATDDEKNWWKVFSLKKVDLDSTMTTLVKRGSECTAYVVDSGIDATHPEFVGVQVTNLFSIDDTFTDNTGHGTAIASLIAGNTCGVTASSLKIVKVFDGTGNIRQSQLLSAFDAIIADFNLNPKQMAVVNLSWSIAKNEYIEQKINTMIDSGVVVVAAAGNSGVQIENVTPASMDRVITVGSYNHNLEPSNFSNFTGTSAVSLTEGMVNGGDLEGWAPGEHIWVATPGGGYSYASGTSMAAAIHSSVVCYNAQRMMAADGNLVPCITNLLSDVTSLSLSRKNLLTYTDVKYKSSINRISTLFNVFTPDMLLPPEVVNVAYRTGESRCSKLFEPLLNITYTMDGELPEGLEIHNGFMYGNVVQDVGFSVHSFKLNLTFPDGSIIIQTVNVIMRAADFDDAKLPTNDPILSIVLLGCTGATCGVCSGSNNLQCLVCGDAKAGECSCECQQCFCQ